MEQPKTKQPSPEQVRLQRFDTIKRFIGFLSSTTQNKHVQKYWLLLDRTHPIKHEKPTQKHIDTVEKFYNNNRENIVNEKIADVSGVIQYSKNVYFNFSEVTRPIKGKDVERLKFHLLVIAYRFEPSEELTQKIAKKRESLRPPKPSLGDSKEAKLIENAMSTVGKYVKPDSEGNVSASNAVMKLAESGELDKLVSQAEGINLSSMLGIAMGLMGGQKDNVLGELLGDVNGKSDK